MSEEMSEEKSEPGLHYKKKVYPFVELPARGLRVVNVLGFLHVPGDRFSS
jgi:hypothetical protein